jgi:hypothetical protein
MMGVAVGAVLVVEGAGTLASGQRAQRPVIERIAETFVAADEPGQHGTFSAGYSQSDANA